jgi:hypothetical protein
MNKKKLTGLGAVLGAILSGYLATKHPKPAPPPADHTAEWTATCQDVWRVELEHEITADGLKVCLDLAQHGDKDYIVAKIRGTKEYADLQERKKHPPEPPAPEHVDPSGIPLGELAQIRGAMWSVRLNVPFGPRPNRDDNIVATDFFEDYSPVDQARILTAYRARGYTHVVVGPLVDSDGYHGLYPPHDWRGAEFDKFLDELQVFWDAGLTPIVFIHPDGWSLEQTRAEFTPLLQSERAQKLIRVVVPSGWEPTRYDWSSATWTLYAKWARQTLPNALVLIHTVTDVDAPVGTDSRGDDNGRPNAEGWARIAPYIHGWLIQNGPYETAPSANPSLAREFCAQFKADGDGAELHSVAWHFKGAGGWTRDSAWGRGVPILLYAAEHTAYESFWKNLPEAASRPWGDLAVSCGADGYLDGGSVAVPRRR